MENPVSGWILVFMFAVIVIGVLFSIWFYHNAVNESKNVDPDDSDYSNQLSAYNEWARFFGTALMTLIMIFGFFKALFEYLSL